MSILGAYGTIKELLTTKFIGTYPFMPWTENFWFGFAALDSFINFWVFGVKVR